MLAGGCHAAWLLWTIHSCSSLIRKTLPSAINCCLGRWLAKSLKVADGRITNRPASYWQRMCHSVGFHVLFHFLCSKEKILVSSPPMCLIWYSSPLCMISKLMHDRGEVWGIKLSGWGGLKKWKRKGKWTQRRPQWKLKEGGTAGDKGGIDIKK